MFQTIEDILTFTLKSLWLVGRAIFELIVPVPSKSVKGEIVLITGAASGIGRELAFQYASHGAIVICWDINEKGNLETVKQIERLGYPKAYAYMCNVANREEVIGVAEKVQKEVGDVTILINNAGIIRICPFLKQTTEDVQQTIDTNVMAHFWTLQAFLPAMVKKNYGHIVAISSISGLMASKILIPYCTSKYAVRGMMESLCQELRVDPKCQIKTTCVYPSIILHTGLFDNSYVDNFIKYPSIITVLEPKYVAECIVNAQRRDMFEVAIPRRMLTAFYLIRLLPVRVIIALQNMFSK